MPPGGRIEDRDRWKQSAITLTLSGYKAVSTNRLLFRSNAALLGFNALHLISELLAQPLPVIVGGRIGTPFSY
jgi:hypothetical protein